MMDLLMRTWEELTGRDSGPLHLRFILQPLLAAILAVRAGWIDARNHRPVFFRAVVQDPKQRCLLFRNAWNDVGKVFITACVLDVIYQLIVFPWIRPGQVLVVATMLAIIPYLVARGLTNRIVTLFVRRTADDQLQA